jgi:hypothetical protein
MGKIAGVKKDCQLSQERHHPKRKNQRIMDGVNQIDGDSKCSGAEQNLKAANRSGSTL